MAKPIEPPPEWASDETNNTEPAALQKQTGWEFEQTGVSDYDNWWKRTAQKWIEYVDSNVIDGDLEIDGNLTVNDDLHVLGNAVFDGDVNIDGDLTVVDYIKHGNVTLNIPGSAGITELEGEREFEFSGYSGSIDIKTLPSTVNTTVWWPIPLKVGDRIKSVTFRLLGINTGVADVVSAADVAIIDANGSPVAGAGASTSGTPSTVSASSMTATCATPAAIGANQHAFAAIVMAAVQDNETGLRVYGVDVTYDHP